MTVMVVTVRNLTQDAVELLNVVMDTVMVMKPKHHVQKIVVVVARKAVMTVNLIGQLTDLNAVILHGMSLVLTVLTWKPTIAGIVLVVTVQVMVIQFVVTGPVMVMKLMKHAQMIVTHLVNVMLVKSLTVMVATNAGLKAGLVMDLPTVKISNMVLT